MTQIIGKKLKYTKEIEMEIGKKSLKTMNLVQTTWLMTYNGSQAFPFVLSSLVTCISKMSGVKWKYERMWIVVFEEKIWKWCCWSVNSSRWKWCREGSVRNRWKLVRRDLRMQWWTHCSHHVCEWNGGVSSIKRWREDGEGGAVPTGDNPQVLLDGF